MLLLLWRDAAIIIVGVTIFVGDGSGAGSVVGVTDDDDGSGIGDHVSGCILGIIYPSPAVS